MNMIGSLVRQVSLRTPRIPSEIKSAFDESKQEGGDGLQLPDMVKLFAQVIGSVEVIYSGVRVSPRTTGFILSIN